MSVSSSVTKTEFSEAVRRYNEIRQCADKRKLCHAPSTSMYFNRDGYVGACCFNRSQPYGQYPQQTIEDIWFGQPRRVLDEQMLSEALPHGCELCVSPLAADNFSNVNAVQFDRLDDPRVVPAAATRADGAAYPLQMEFELSNNCNLECVMCSGMFSSSIRKNREGLPPFPMCYDSEFVRQLRPFIPHLHSAKFYGGEPFMVQPYYEIWELMAELNPGIRLVVTTNATILNDRVKRLLEAMDFDLVLSIDSIVKETYEAIRINADYDSVMGHIDYFADYAKRRGRTLTFAVCPMTLNALEMPALVEFCNERGIMIGFNTVEFPHELSMRNLPAESLAEIIDVYERFRPDGATTLHRHNFERFQGVLNMVRYWQGLRVKTEDSPFAKRLEQHLEDLGNASLEGKVARYMYLYLLGSGNEEAARAVLFEHFQIRSDDQAAILAYVEACIAVYGRINDWPPSRMQELQVKAKASLERYMETGGISLEYVLSSSPHSIVEYLVDA